MRDWLRIRKSSWIRSGIWFVGRRWRLVLLFCLVVFHALNNWAWLSTNVTIIGSDPRRHLMTALQYSDTLRPFSLVNLFDAVILDDYRPPLFQLSAVPLLWLFGRSTDVATMVNVVYIAILLGATYAIGKRMLGANVGLLACFVLSTFPMTYGMSRYFYIDFALMAMVTLNLALLLQTESFERKGYTLLYGLSFGLGMLVKWTFVVFTFVPAIVFLVRGGLCRRVIRRLKAGSVDTRWALLSAVTALVLVLVWYVPNLDRARQMFLGLWLLPICWIALALSFYAISRPSSRETNVCAAVFVAFSVASVWYMPRIGFLREFFLVAYGKAKGTYWGFLPYRDYLINEQLSPFYFTVLLLALLVIGFSHLRRLRAFTYRDVLSSPLAVLGSWAVVPYLVFSFRTSTIHSRYLMPILPSLALIIAFGLVSVPWKKARTALLLAVVIIAVAQFFALSYDGLDWLRDVATVQPPNARQFNLFAHGYENQLPSTGLTDSRYWVMPDVLRFIREDSTQAGREAPELGILMKTHYVQASTFWLVSMVEGHGELRMRELARAWSSAPVYPQLLEVDYLVLKDGSQEGTNREETRELVDAILSGSCASVSEVFEVAQSYPLPDGDTVYLYAKKRDLDGGH
jgi:4-amino-4-deoxy-L-arabinose transferase-like glycosyltransferase